MFYFRVCFQIIGQNYLFTFLKTVVNKSICARIVSRWFCAYFFPILIFTFTHWCFDNLMSTSNHKKTHIMSLCCVLISSLIMCWPRCVLIFARVIRLLQISHLCDADEADSQSNVERLRWTPKFIISYLSKQNFDIFGGWFRHTSVWTSIQLEARTLISLGSWNDPSQRSFHQFLWVLWVW